MITETIGQGSPLLYLHDWGFSSQVWSHQVDHFRGHYRNCLVNYNLTRLDPALAHDTLLDHLCHRILDQWKEPGPFGILAHGFGAFLAYELIERGWEPGGLVLFGGLLRFTNGEGYLSGLAPDQVDRMRHALRQSPHDMLTDYYRSAFSGDAETVPGELGEAMPLNAQDFLKLAFDTMISHDYQEMVAALPVHTLIVQGEADRIVPVWQGQLLRRLLRNSEMYVCKGSGHVPFFTRYATLNRRVGRFFEKVGP